MRISEIYSSHSVIPTTGSTNTKFQSARPKESLIHRALQTTKTIRRIGSREYIDSMFIFSPVREQFPVPLSLTSGDFGTDNVSFTNRNGDKLNGYLVRNQSIRRSKLGIFLQGRSHNASFWLERLKQIPQQTDLDLFAPDYSGYGLSEGFPTKVGILEDIAAAHRFARDQGYRPENIYFLCHSLGTLVGLEYHAYRNGAETAGTVLFGPPTSLKDAARVNLGRVPAMFTSKHLFNSRKTITNLVHRILIVCGEDDKKSPIEQGKELHDIALDWKKDSSFLRVEAGHHSDIFDREEVLRALKGFTSKP